MIYIDHSNQDAHKWSIEHSISHYIISTELNHRRHSRSHVIRHLWEKPVLIPPVREFCTPVPQQHYFCLQLPGKFVSLLTADERHSSAFQYKIANGMDNRMLMVLLLQSFHILQCPFSVLSETLNTKTFWKISASIF